MKVYKGGTGDMRKVDEEKIVSVIASAGSAKSFAFQAMEEAEEGDLSAAWDSLEEARKALVEGHQAHTDILHIDVTEGVEVTLLIVHASNHLSNAEMSIDFAERIIKLYERGVKNA